MDQQQPFTHRVSRSPARDQFDLEQINTQRTFSLRETFELASDSDGRRNNKLTTSQYALALSIKSIIDYFLATFAIVALAPFFFVIGIFIRLGSPGPVFFSQSRGGYRGSTIKVIKFRTMNVMEDGAIVVQANRDDKRITPIGRFLRRTSLDELPQLFNVLRGELSLVGPRPHAISHDRYYGSSIKEYYKRYQIKPGITGWAQVHGLRGGTADVDLMRQRVEYDLFYLENWSLYLDLKILLWTVLIVFKDKTAY